ncbi:MAG: helix-turn-helix domain-containing protein, partial [Peptostreptococcaceae bacterium]
KIDINLIKLQMLKKGYLISKPAKESNLGKSTVSRVIKQIGITRPQTIQKIAQALDINIKDLML